MSRPFHYASLEQLPIVGILRGFGHQVTANMIAAAVEGGLLNAEVTMNTPGAVEMIAAAIQATPDEVNIGAGTVCTMEELDAAMAAGASYIVSPIVAPEVIQTCIARDVPIFPGAMTPTEIYRAAELGATMVKVFPAPVLGPKFIQLVRGPLDQIDLLPTGGITLENMAEYFAVGAAAVGVASPIFNRQATAGGDFNFVREQATAFATRYSKIRRTA